MEELPADLQKVVKESAEVAAKYHAKNYSWMTKLRLLTSLQI